MVKNINSITIKLSDFGLTTDSVNNLKTGKIGTKGYTAPEVELSYNVIYDNRADVYSFGIMMNKIWDTFVNEKKSINLIDLLKKMTYYEPI